MSCEKAIIPFNDEVGRKTHWFAEDRDYRLQNARIKLSRRKSNDPVKSLNKW